MNINRISANHICANELEDQNVSFIDSMFTINVLDASPNSLNNIVVTRQYPNVIHPEIMKMLALPNQK